MAGINREYGGECIGRYLLRSEQEILRMMPLAINLRYLYQVDRYLDVVRDTYLHTNLTYLLRLHRYYARYVLRYVLLADPYFLYLP